MVSPPRTFGEPPRLQAVTERRARLPHVRETAQASRGGSRRQGPLAGRALQHYDQAKALLAASDTAEDVIAVEQVVADARYHRAAVLAIREGEPLPQRREPCFFNPQHGPSMQDLEWTPPGGTPRVIAICAADARRLAAGEGPLVRMVRVGDRWVPWHLGGSVRGAIDARAQLARSGSHGVHGQQNLAQAYLNQARGGVDGGTGIGGFGS